MVNHIYSLQPNHGTQCFPFYLYDAPEESAEEGLFTRDNNRRSPTPIRRDGISDAGLAHFQAAYPAKGEGSSITKEDLFYYIYGLLHSPDYRTRYAENLGKELPRIPAVRTFADFRAFSKAGRDLAHWHLNYETVEKYPGTKLDTGKAPLGSLTDADYRVTKMKFGKTRDASGKSVSDKTTVHYNERITITNIPLEAYDYVVNGKPALEWVMERQAVTTDKDSGIVNDANLWATETMGNAKYPLELFLRVITVSLETVSIVNSLPPLTVGDCPEDSFQTVETFLERQLGENATWKIVYREILAAIRSAPDGRIKLSNVLGIAERIGVQQKEVFSILGLLSTPKADFLDAEFRQFSDGKYSSVQSEDVIERIRQWWREKAVGDLDWREWASRIEVSWTLKRINDDKV